MLAKQLEDTSSDVLVILDCCHAGAISTPKHDFYRLLHGRSEGTEASSTRHVLAACSWNLGTNGGLIFKMCESMMRWEEKSPRFPMTTRRLCEVVNSELKHDHKWKCDPQLVQLSPAGHEVTLILPRSN